MGEIVAGFGVPHTPAFPARIDRDGPTETAQLFRTVAQHLEEVKPDALIVFTSDHFNTFFLDNYPNLLIGVSDRTAGPNDGTPGIKRSDIPVAEQLASHLYGFGLQQGFDFGLSQEFEVDHTVMVPLHYLTPRMSLPIVPIFVNGVVHPLPGARRCYALGQMVREAVEALPASSTVAVLGSGSWSLDVGGHLAPRGQYSGAPDPDWVEALLDYLRNGRIEDLLDAATAERMARAGNVGGELLDWIATLGVIGDRRPRFLEPEMEHGHAYGVWRWDQ